MTAGWSASLHTMTPADLGAAIAGSVRQAVADGDLPRAALPATDRAAESVRTRPDGGYVTPVALRLAGAIRWHACAVADVLAPRLRALPGVVDVTVDRFGFCEVFPSRAAYAETAREIVRAGTDYRRSWALAGTMIDARRAGDLRACAGIEQARARVTVEVAGRLAQACGAEVRWAPPSVSDCATGRALAELLEAAGMEVCRYALLRGSAGRPPEPARWARAHPDNPAYAVRYTHAHAAGTRRQAVRLGVRANGDAAADGALPHGRDRVLVSLAAELPARVAGATRGRPADLACYLERLVGAYWAWWTAVPVLPRSGRPATATHGARLWVVAAVQTVLAAGLDLLGLRAPARM